jgi:arylsulfatase A-like enzyme
MVVANVFRLLVLALIGSSFVGIAPAVAADSKPNVLFIAVDDLNDWVGCLGGHPQAQTPHLDRLAERGTLFTNAHCQAPLCNPSRTSMLTGLRPSTTGIYALEPWFRTVKRFEHHVALPQYFMASGYRAMSVGKIWHGGYPPKEARPTEFTVFGPNSAGARPKKKLVETPGGNHPAVDWGLFEHADEDTKDAHSADWAIEQIETAKAGEPFFLAVGFHLPHVPCYASKKWMDLYPAEKLTMPPVKEDDRDDLPRFASYMNWRLPEVRLSWLRQHNEWENLVQSYLACISFMDSQVGRLLDAVDASGHAERTVIVLWSDHGWHVGEKGATGKTTLWERSTRVPMIFAGPGVAKNARCTQPAELLDIYPTLVELCGLPQKDGLEGHSLAPQLKDAQARRLWPAVTTHGPDNHTVRTERWRYTRYADGSEELYDEVSDPNEWTNLAGASEHAAIRSELAQWLPARSAPPAPGSVTRLIEIRDGVPYWEGEAIGPNDRWDE